MLLLLLFFFCKQFVTPSHQWIRQIYFLYLFSFQHRHKYTPFFFNWFFVCCLLFKNFHHWLTAHLSLTQKRDHKLAQIRDHKLDQKLETLTLNKRSKTWSKNLKHLLYDFPQSAWCCFGITSFRRRQESWMASIDNRWSCKSLKSPLFL